MVEETLTKFVRIRVNSKDRQGWGRLAVNAISKMNKILKDYEIADLVERVESLEAKLK